MKNNFKFVENFKINGKYQTGIWFNERTSQYSSVISDLEPVTFSTLDEIKLYIKGTMEDWKNG